MPTANGWELYTCSEDDETKAAVKAAVPALNAALREAKKEVRARLRLAIKEGRVPGWRRDRVFHADSWDRRTREVASSVVHGVFNDVVSPVQDRHSDSGAADSEPRYVALGELRKVAAAVLKVDETDL